MNSRRATEQEGRGTGNRNRYRSGDKPVELPLPALLSVVFFGEG